MSVARTGLLLLISLVILGSRAAQAQTLMFDTSASPFTAGHSNQGYYSDNNPHDPNNDNYVVGTITGDQYRDFFSFDLSSLSLTGRAVTFATLTVTRFAFQTDSGRSSQQLGLFDVSTSASALKTTSGANTTFFNDLGSGNSYGTFAVPGGASTDTVTLPLNTLALGDITRARGGFFSVGGALATATADAGNFVNESLFTRSSRPNVAQLTVTLAPVPEPAAWIVPSLGLLGIAGLSLRARRRAS